jgi:hypothetical protein
LNRKPQTGLLGALLLLALALCVSCRTAPPLPPADLSAPGWRVQQGQALWKPTKDRPRLAGDLLLATNTDGSYFVQLTKTPFTLVTAESFAGRWQIEFGAGEHSWRGTGIPPERFAWFQLPRALLDGKTAGPWSFENVGANSWRLENPKTGETLEGGFFP